MCVLEWALSYASGRWVGSESLFIPILTRSNVQSWRVFLSWQLGISWNGSVMIIIVIFISSPVIKKTEIWVEVECCKVPDLFLHSTKRNAFILLYSGFFEIVLRLWTALLTDRCHDFIAILNWNSTDDLYFFSQSVIMAKKTEPGTKIKYRFLFNRSIEKSVKKDLISWWLYYINYGYCWSSLRRLPIWTYCLYFIDSFVI